MVEPTNGDYFGRITHYNKNQGSSTVDLAIISCSIHRYVKSFMVMPQLDISDHCKVIIKLDNIVVKNKADKINDDYVWVQKPESFKWHPDALEFFKETLSNNKDIDELISDAEQRLEAGLIETTGKRIQDIFYKNS